MLKIKKKILLIHLVLLGLIFLNLLVFFLFDISLNNQAKLILKIAYFISGFIAFFFFFRPFTKLSLFFSYFVIGPILACFAWLADGIMGVIVFSFYFWLLPNSAVCSNNDFVIYRKSQGFLGSGNEYELYEKIGFLEIKRDSFTYNPMFDFNANETKIIYKNKEIQVYYKDSIIHSTYFN